MVLMTRMKVDAVQRVAAGSPDESLSKIEKFPPPPPPHLPPRLLLVIVADVSGLGEQRAGERRQLPSLRALTRTQDTRAARTLFVC